MELQVLEGEALPTKPAVATLSVVAAATVALQLIGCVLLCLDGHLHFALARVDALVVDILGRVSECLVTVEALEDQSICKVAAKVSGIREGVEKRLSALLARVGVCSTRVSVLRVFLPMCSCGCR